MSDLTTNELIPPVVEQPASFSERVALKTTSGRLVCMVIMCCALCYLTIDSPTEWKSEFVMALSGLLGSYLTRGTGGAR